MVFLLCMQIGRCTFDKKQWLQKIDKQVKLVLETKYVELNLG